MLGWCRAMGPVGSSAYAGEGRVPAYKNVNMPDSAKPRVIHSNPVRPRAAAWYGGVGERGAVPAPHENESARDRVSFASQKKHRAPAMATRAASTRKTREQTMTAVYGVYDLYVPNKPIFPYPILRPWRAPSRRSPVTCTNTALRVARSRHVRSLTTLPSGQRTAGLRNLGERKRITQV